MLVAVNRSLNHYPWWKYLLLVAVIVLGIIYALPNLYGEDPAVQVTSNATGVTVDDNLQAQINSFLQSANIAYQDVVSHGSFLQFRFKNTDDQLKAEEILKSKLGENYTVALSLAPATPSWLQDFGAEPMKLGLDLRGGVHFLLDVDVNGVLAQRLAGTVKNIGELLRANHLRYSGLNLNNDNITLQFRDNQHFDQVTDLLKSHFSEFTLLTMPNSSPATITLSLTPDAVIKADDEVIEQTMTKLTNRVDELGVSNAVVQRQGASRIAIDLPGVLDAGRAKQILGGTATLEFHIVDDAHDPSQYIGLQPPLGLRLYKLNAMPLLLKNEIVLQGSSITSALPSLGEDGRPSIDIRLGGGGEALFSRVTRDSIGKQMAIVYVETKVNNQMVNGQPVKTYEKVERVISAPVIQSALGTNFQITGITDQREATNLALLLRAGALPANIDIIQERTVGPTLGKENIQKGLLSVAIGFIAVIIIMGFYYQLFGLIANLALFLNLILLTALLSLLGMVLTLPGIAGVVLTVGMAVDANVLIFERIREEMRIGISPQASIHAGYERAFSTIVDANVTTLIAALVLFYIGTGPIKGFAVTLTLGILTSMVTAITGTRAIVNLIYGRKRKVEHLSIGL